MTLSALNDRLAARPSEAGLFLDFDGTLAPIVADPATSALPASLGAVLGRLARHLGVVAVVSGRPVAFLADRVAVDGVRLLGLYGLQEWVDGTVRPRPEAIAWASAVDAAKDAMAGGLPGAQGVVLEDKGLSVALHWRNAPDRERAGRLVGLLTRAVAAQTGLHRESGKLVEELRPPVDWDKGAAVRALAADLGLRTVVVVGDDLGDLPAFAAAQELGGAAVAVEAGRETPAELREAADVTVGGTQAIATWLGDLAEILDPGGVAPAD